MFYCFLVPLFFFPSTLPLLTPLPLPQAPTATFCSLLLCLCTPSSHPSSSSFSSSSSILPCASRFSTSSAVRDFLLTLGLTAFCSGTPPLLLCLIPASGWDYPLICLLLQGVVMAAVRVFYMRVMSDETLRTFFEDIDLARLKNKLVGFQTTPSKAQHEGERETTLSIA